MLLSKTLEVQSTGVVAAFTFLWLVATTGLYPLLLPDEGRYVGVAWSMLSDDQYSVPRLNGLPFFHKPPLFYWLTAFALDVFGVNEWAARLASACSATLMVTLLFWFLKEYVNQRVAIVAALILATQPLFFGGSHYANLDMTVAALITATTITGAVAIFKYESQAPYRFVLTLAYALAAAAFLAKGLIGVVLPGGILFFWLLWRRRFATMWRMVSLPGIAVFLLLALPWMIYMQQRYPGFFDYYIVYQHFYRFMEKGFNNARPIWFYVPVLLGLTLPWSIQLWRVAKHRWHENGRDAAVRGLMLSWLLVVLVFFSIPNSKLIGYIIPCLVPLAYFIAEPFAFRMREGHGLDPPKGFFWSLIVAIAICMTAVVVMIVNPQQSTKGLAYKLKGHYQPNDEIVMLERYRYDLDFYLGTGKAAMVVLDWDDPEIKKSDNWSRELFDAGLFDPETASQLLIRPQQLTNKLCSDRSIDLWLVGDINRAARHEYLRDVPVALDDGKLRAWHIPAGPALSFCAEMPRPGPG
ncbi:glycosyltransferase family 39 protein [Candidimonas sp. SYP-B2681]|uniref:ArnT family glycosyltransferase n=1 Tax=Candidimonas sp. SYP-B2681 TaxID=2497686 RepID=UPI00131559D8|nr:glycosyltransferase family 39 protein [Candidimonas sp. SYP-B2681]